MASVLGKIVRMPKRWLRPSAVTAGVGKPFSSQSVRFWMQSWPWSMLCTLTSTSGGSTGSTALSNRSLNWLVLTGAMIAMRKRRGASAMLDLLVRSVNGHGRELFHRHIRPAVAQRVDLLHETVEDQPARHAQQRVGRQAQQRHGAPAVSRGQAAIGLHDVPVRRHHLAIALEEPADAVGRHAQGLRAVAGPDQQRLVLEI